MKHRVTGTMCADTDVADSFGRLGKVVGGCGDLQFKVRWLYPSSTGLSPAGAEEYIDYRSPRAQQIEVLSMPMAGDTRGIPDWWDGSKRFADR